MSRVLTFSTTYPSYHPRAGELTLFVEKIWKGLYEDRSDALYSHELSGIWSMYCELIDTIEPKYHTIRAKKRYKAGMKVSPRFWSGKPYASKQIQFAPDIEIKKVWDFEIKNERIFIDGRAIGSIETADLCLNDGLKMRDFFDWFKWPTPFSGQIICWNENIKYNGE